jgi:predicted ATP-grasp superfamily ATP-dependent carboligase|tara:strand:+ start:88 stop:318 length:231 start_codon:yes stop_codon:yes gene_type:complete
MKESTLIEMQKKVESLTRVMQHVLTENNRLTEMSVGTLELIKMMPDYDKALDDLKEKNLEQIKKEKEDVKSQVGEG